MTSINTTATQRKLNKAIYLALNTCKLIINQPITANSRNIVGNCLTTVSAALQRIGAELNPYQTDIRLITNGLARTDQQFIRGGGKPLPSPDSQE
jgi:hypothetical protein